MQQHDVLYSGWAEEGKGIWGIWHIPHYMKGGFHLWPKGMADPTRSELAAKAKEPAETNEKEELLPVGPAHEEEVG